MPYDEDNNKWSCMACIAGHRVQECVHYQAVMCRVRKPGRPSKTCGKRDQCYMVEIRRENRKGVKHPISICRPAPVVRDDEPSGPSPQEAERIKAEQYAHEMQRQYADDYLHASAEELIRSQNELRWLEAQACDPMSPFYNPTTTTTTTTHAMSAHAQAQFPPQPAMAVNPSVIHTLNHQCAPHTSSCCSGGGDFANTTTTTKVCGCPSTQECQCLGCVDHPMNPADQTAIAGVLSQMTQQDIDESIYSAPVPMADDVRMAPADSVHRMHFHAGPGFGLVGNMAFPGQAVMTNYDWNLEDFQDPNAYYVPQ